MAVAILRKSCLTRGASPGSMADIMTLAEIKTGILPTLTLEEKFELAGLLAAEGAVVNATADIDEAEEERWDEQLREDFKNHGPMWQLAQEAIAEDERGETLPGWP